MEVLPLPEKRSVIGAGAPFSFPFADSCLRPYAIHITPCYRAPNKCDPGDLIRVSSVTLHSPLRTMRTERTRGDLPFGGRTRALSQAAVSAHLLFMESSDWCCFLLCVK